MVGVTVTYEGVIMPPLSDAGVYQHPLEFVLIVFGIGLGHAVLLTVLVAYRGSGSGSGLG